MKLLIYLKLGVFIFGPIVLFFIPVSFLNTLPEVCLFKNLTGKECYGCGMTHAVVSIFHGNFIEAFYFNKLIIIVFPLLVYLWIWYIVREIKKLF